MKQNTAIAEDVLRGTGLPFGIAAYDQVLPLLPCRAAARIPKAAKSVICVLFPYYTGEQPKRNLSRYAVVEDYHRIAGGILERLAGELGERFPGHCFAAFTDNSPIREVTAAWLAGLGVVGQNGLLIHRRYGSYVFIGELVCDLELETGQPVEGGCLGCGRCRRACPEGALGERGQLRLERCRSHITQKKGQLSPWEEEQVIRGGLAWGCDICNDVCPMNGHPPETTPLPAFLESAEPVLDRERARLLLPNRAYGYRGEGVILRNLDLLERGGQHPEE